MNKQGTPEQLIGLLQDYFTCVKSDICSSPPPHPRGCAPHRALCSKYRMTENQKRQNRAVLSNKLPEIEKALAAVLLLQSKAAVRVAAGERERGLLTLSCRARRV